MSHFVGIVLVKRKSTLFLERSIAKLVAPYSENRRVPAYQRPCSCIDLAILDIVELEADAKFGSYEVYRQRFSQQIEADAQLRSEQETYGNTLFAPDDCKLSRAWAELTADRRAFEEARKQALKSSTQPDPKCEQCNGTGSYRTTYNPQSKWDWYEVGGRWKGCLGADKDIAPATHWLNLLESSPDTSTPYCVVTPDGQWHGRGEMGWWGVSSGDRQTEAWRKEVLCLARQHQNGLAVVVDFHI
jgi:hypothetical protein